MRTDNRSRDGTARARHPHEDLLSGTEDRRVYRVALGYVVAGSATVQVVGTVLPIFHAPDSARQLFVVLVALGFPFALVLAWSFDVERHNQKNGGWPWRHCGIKPAPSVDCGRHGFSHRDVGTRSLLVLAPGQLSCTWNQRPALPLLKRASPCSPSRT